MSINPIDASAAPASGKAARRDHVIQAARSLIRETAGAGFSMTALAVRAGVSPATPYNLVGPRTRVLEVLVEQEFADFRRRLSALAGAPGLSRIVEATLLVTEHYGADLAFYRGLFRAMVTAGGEELRRMMGTMGLDLWLGLVSDAAGEIDPRVAPEPFTDHLLEVVSSITLAWTIENWDAARYRAEMRYAVTVTLAGVAAASRRADLMDDLAGAQAELLRLRAAAPQGASR